MIIMIRDNGINKRLIKFSYITIFVLLIFSSVNYFSGAMVAFYVDIFVAISLLLNIKSKLVLTKKISIFLSLGMILLVFLFYHSVEDSGWLWSLVFPAFIFLLNGTKQGIVWTFMFGSVLLSILLFQIVFDIDTPYSNYQLFVFIAVYSLISNLMYLFKKEIDLYTSQLIGFNDSLEKKVQDEVEKNKLKDKMLNNKIKQAQMGEMVSMIAHQWRQPLNAICASAIRLKLENDMKLSTQNSVDEISTFIQKQTQDMSEVINSFLEFSKPLNEDVEFNLLNALDKSLSILNAQFKINSVSVEKKYNVISKDIVITGSQNLLQQVILNLLINIKDAFDEQQDNSEQKIDIIVDKNGDIKIVDNAGGIDNSISNKVFNPYFTTKEQGKGVGLGLYMSRKIMREYFDGDLIYTPLDYGSCFEIIFNKNLDKGK